MLVLKESVSASVEVKKSKFISYLCRISNHDELKSMRDKLALENRLAKHIVYAAVLDRERNLFASSDDREPKNTAGKPCLEILKGTDADEIAVFIVRYFGGILLGKGGLVHAYSLSCKNALEKACFVEEVKREELVLKSTYQQYSKLSLLFKEYDIDIIKVVNEEFITFNVSVPVEFVGKLSEKLKTLSINITKI